MRRGAARPRRRRTRYTHSPASIEGRSLLPARSVTTRRLRRVRRAQHTLASASDSFAPLLLLLVAQLSPGRRAGAPLAGGSHVQLPHTLGLGTSSDGIQSNSCRRADRGLPSSVAVAPRPRSLVGAPGSEVDTTSEKKRCRSHPTAPDSAEGRRNHGGKRGALGYSPTSRAHSAHDPVRAAAVVGTVKRG